MKTYKTHSSMLPWLASLLFAFILQSVIVGPVVRQQLIASCERHQTALNHAYMRRRSVVQFEVPLTIAYVSIGFLATRALMPLLAGIMILAMPEHVLLCEVSFPADVTPERPNFLVL